ncbi:hypothetical protein F4779DRAFT_177672 [Xylariaceae sp. FL0662B]|nr:hypothetical protein F4779DRAFT_177672 [Xylariaceae sp. FL0662B]
MVQLNRTCLPPRNDFRKSRGYLVSLLSIRVFSRFRLLFLQLYCLPSASVPLDQSVYASILLCRGFLLRMELIGAVRLDVSPLAAVETSSQEVFDFGRLRKWVCLYPGRRHDDVIGVLQLRGVVGSIIYLILPSSSSSPIPRGVIRRTRFGYSIFIAFLVCLYEKISNLRVVIRVLFEVIVFIYKLGCGFRFHSVNKFGVELRLPLATG